MKYRKKPVVIEAVQYDGNFRCLDIFSINDVGKFIVGTDDAGNPCLKIPTLEGVMIASKGDYVIRGIKGEYYPCKPDIFEMTYERDEPTVIQKPIKNYDPWDEVIDQLGDTDKMISKGGELSTFKDHVPDVGKMVDDDIKAMKITLDKVDSYRMGYNRAKQTLYTEEEVMEAVSKSVSILIGQEINLAQLKELIIQLLKQPKQ